MRALAIIGAAVLSGCALVATTVFDPVEYDQWTRTAYAAQQTTKLCDTNEAIIGVKLLASQIEYATLYSSGKVQNARVQEAAGLVKTMSTEFTKRYEGAVPSAAYCKIKAHEIETASRRIAESLSKKEM